MQSALICAPTPSTDDENLDTRGKFFGTNSTSRERRLVPRPWTHLVDHFHLYLFGKGPEPSLSTTETGHILHKLNPYGKKVK